MEGSAISAAGMATSNAQLPPPVANVKKVLLPRTSLRSRERWSKEEAVAVHVGRLFDSEGENGESEQYS